jgi:23S rRNA (cytidine1920-2'-O)/16S rRNA (cytidine1409-2'-O)-methyltransferase
MTSDSAPTDSVLADQAVMGEEGHTRRLPGQRVPFGPVARVRLDTLLADRGLFDSRTRAAASVMAGEVRVGADGRRAQKPGQMVDPDVVVAVDELPRFVSRGGIKLANALERFAIDVRGRHALDVGASTGGFTDCLLQAGAEHVVALDVAYGEFVWGLRNDARVTVRERTNARSIKPGDLPYAPDLVVIDVSFIALAKVLPAVLATTALVFDVLAMVKPQFEVGRGNVGRGGVVRDPAERRAALVAAAQSARALGACVLGFASSGLPGPKGNRESFVWLAEAGRSGDVGDDLNAAAREVEP